MLRLFRGLAVSAPASSALDFPIEKRGGGMPLLSLPFMANVGFGFSEEFNVEAGFGFGFGFGFFKRVDARFNFGSGDTSLFSDFSSLLAGATLSSIGLVLRRRLKRLESVREIMFDEGLLLASASLLLRLWLDALVCVSGIFVVRFVYGEFE